MGPQIAAHAIDRAYFGSLPGSTRAGEAANLAGYHDPIMPFWL